MLKFDRICFYSHYGNGDLFNSREIIKDIIEINPNVSYEYAHSKGQYIFSDIPEIAYRKVEPFMRADQPFVLGQDKDVYINTWIGHNPKYVLPGVGCTLEKYIEMFHETLNQLELNRPNKLVEDYIPTIKHSDITKAYVDRTFEKFNEHRFVLICNGDVQSNQAENFDFNPIIKDLCISFPKIGFITTAHCPYFEDFENLHDISDWNLNYISLASQKCTTVIGRSSGPYVFSQVEENIGDKSKTFISFTYHINASKLFTSVQPTAKMIWSPETKLEKVLEVIKKELL